MTDYENSSHLSSWIFTPEELVNARARANQDAIRFLEEQRLRKASSSTSSSTSEAATATTTTTAATTTTDSTPLPTQILPPQSFAKIQKQQQKDQDHSPSSSSSPRILPPDPLPSTIIDTSIYLTPQEELNLLQFYATKLSTLIGPSAMVKGCAKPSKVASTAAMFLKRFYLSNSVMMYDPKCVMVASAFLASKVEDMMVHIKYIEDGTKSLQSHVSLQSIINSENTLINGIDFDLLCYHPYATIQAYTDDLRSFKSKNPNGDGTFRRYVSILDLSGITNNTNTNNSNNKNHDDDDDDDDMDGTDTDTIDSPTRRPPHRRRPRHKVDARDLLAPVYALARTLVETVSYGICGDVVLIATPGQIGLAALYVANERLMAQAKQRAAESAGEEEEEGKRRRRRVVEDVVKIDFEGYIQNRFPGKVSDHRKVWEKVKEIGAVLEEESKWVQDMVVLKGIHKKLKGCRAWGGKEGEKKTKKKKTKKRKRVEEEEGVAT